MSTAQLDPETEIAIDAVRAAARVCRAVAAGHIDAVTKADDSPVTIADFAAQAVVMHRLQQRLGAPTVVGEEAAEVLRGDEALADAVVAAARVSWPDATRDAVLAAIDAGAARQADGRYWTLDPIDGTKGFLRRGQYAVCLAWVEGASALRGVLACPNLSRAADGSPAQVDPSGVVFATDGVAPVVVTGIDDDRREHLPSTPAAIEGALVITHSVESGHTRIDNVDEVVRRLGRAYAAMPSDSQAKYGLVARGQAHAYLRIPTNRTRVEAVWDHAAGTAIASRAGMRVTDLRGAVFDFSSPAGLRHNFGILCAHPEIHGALVEAIAALGLADA